MAEAAQGRVRFPELRGRPEGVSPRSPENYPHSRTGTTVSPLAGASTTSVGPVSEGDAILVTTDAGPVAAEIYDGQGRRQGEFLIAAAGSHLIRHRAGRVDIRNDTAGAINAAASILYAR